MKKSVKISMIVAGCLMGVGLISGLIGMTLIGFDFGNIDDQKFEKRAMVIGKNENINEIDCIMINTINDDIEYKVSEDETLRIEYYASNNITYDIDVLDDLSMNSYEDEEEEPRVPLRERDSGDRPSAAAGVAERDEVSRVPPRENVQAASGRGDPFLYG